MLSIVRAEDSGGLDWLAWQRMPVLQDKRIMPLDSFALIAGRQDMRHVEATRRQPRGMNKAELKAMSAEEIQQWVRANQPRRFLAAELLYSWTVEPEKWEDVPFLYAAGDKLRGTCSACRCAARTAAG